MKFYTVGKEPDEKLFSTLRGLKAYLKEHPEEEGAYLWWYYRDELVECRFISRDDILKGKGTRRSKGCTAQWAASRGQL